MNLIQRYRRLSLWSKIAFWGSIASITALILMLPTPKVFQFNTTLVQQGTIKVDQNGYYDVYYLTPYKGTPELKWPEVINGPDRNSFEIIEQRPDGFRIDLFRWNNTWTNGIHWQTRGIRAK